MSKYGIKVISNASDHARKPPFDIVFVHGLRGSGETTWKGSESKESWPKALLSKAIPEARIMFFSYDADIVHLRSPAGENRIANHARNLLSRLHTKRMEEAQKNRPIIFVAHSLGGLVVQNALALSDSSPEPHIQRIVESTKGVIFLGVPHHGSNAAKYAEFLAGLTAAFRPTNENLLDVLKPDSEVLAAVTAGFHEMLKKRLRAGLFEIRLVSFFEELPMQKMGKSYTIVTKESAILNGYESYSIHGDHETMTKFPDNDPDDDGYEAVKVAIITISELPVEAKPGRAAAAARESWTNGTRSGVVNQGDVKIKSNTFNSSGNITVGNFIR